MSSFRVRAPFPVTVTQPQQPPPHSCVRGCVVACLCGQQEAKFRALVRRDAPRVVLYNARHLSRVYPNPIRVDSSNFDPFVGWALGVQMTALNYQTHGLPMLLNLVRRMAAWLW